MVISPQREAWERMAVGGYLLCCPFCAAPSLFAPARVGFLFPFRVQGWDVGFRTAERHQPRLLEWNTKPPTLIPMNAGSSAKGKRSKESAPERERVQR